MTDARKNELLDLVLFYTTELERDTMNMTNGECVYFLESLRTAIKAGFERAVPAAEDVFRNEKL